VSIDWEKIHLYLDEKLNESEKINFEKEIDSNKELQKILDDLKTNDFLLKQLPKHTTSSNFLVNLNTKIDTYEKPYFYWLNAIMKNWRNFKTVPMLATISVFLVISFSTFKIVSNDNTIDNIGNIDSKHELIAINDDTLSESEDTLNYNKPTLLIGNDK